MANILDYLDWRGDLSFRIAPFNEVDNLILSELAYLDLTEVVASPLQRNQSVPLEEVAQQLQMRSEGQPVDMGLLVPKQIPELFQKAAKSRRFAGVKLNYFASEIDYTQEKQFAAVTAELGDGSIYVAFRGTDDTLVGWKEDFNMSFLQTVPSQQEALEYLERVARYYPRTRLRIGGHSKGGNLAVYSAMHCRPRLQQRILEIYNNDGPGFSKAVIDEPAYQAIRSRIRTIVPQSSVVGMLLEHEEEYQVVQSTQVGLWQHDGFSWEVLGERFIHLEEIEPEARAQNQTLKNLINGMTPQQREIFADALYEVLTTNDAKTLRQVQEEGLQLMLNMPRALMGLDKQTKDAVAETVKQLFRKGAQNLKEDLGNILPGRSGGEEVK